MSQALLARADSQSVLKLRASDRGSGKPPERVQIEVASDQNRRVPTVSPGVVKGLVKLGALKGIPDAISAIIMKLLANTGRGALSDSPAPQAIFGAVLLNGKHSSAYANQVARVICKEPHRCGLCSWFHVRKEQEVQSERTCFPAFV